MGMNNMIKTLERAIEVERAELEGIIQIYLEQNKALSEDVSLINRGQKLDEMIYGLHGLKNGKA